MRRRWASDAGIELPVVADEAGLSGLAVLALAAFALALIGLFRLHAARGRQRRELPERGARLQRRRALGSSRRGAGPAAGGAPQGLHGSAGRHRRRPQDRRLGARSGRFQQGRGHRRGSPPLHVAPRARDDREHDLSGAALEARARPLGDVLGQHAPGQASAGLAVRAQGPTATIATTQCGDTDTRDDHRRPPSGSTEPQFSR